jgi:hypothetical protein
MVMNIKKIIREEVNEFDWVGDVSGVYVGMRYRHIRDGKPISDNINTVVSVDGRNGFNVIDSEGDEDTIPMRVWDMWIRHYTITGERRVEVID